MTGATRARALSLWAWRILISRHGPRDSAMRACLWALATFLDQDGEGWATQRQIADAACLSERTVREKLDRACKLYWLGMRPRGVPGRKWKTYEFRACIPAGLNILRRSDDDGFPEKVESLMEGVEVRCGDIGPEWLRGSHFRQPGRKKKRREGLSGLKGNGIRDGNLTTCEMGNSRQQDRKLTTARPARDSDTVSHTVSQNCSPNILGRPVDRPPVSVATTVDSQVATSESDTRKRLIKQLAMGDRSTEEVAQLAGISSDDVRRIVAEAGA